MIEDKNYILIVDDEDSILELLANYLEGQAHQVVTARHAEAAMKLLGEQAQIDLVITDINLPGMSGLELLKFVRQTSPEIPVVLITGYRKLDFAISAVRHGAHDYIIKPFQLSEVRKIVEKVLRYRNKSRSNELLFQYAGKVNANFKFPTRELDAGAVANYLARFLLSAGFCDKNDFNQYYMAFVETLINAIEHGNLELSSDIKDGNFKKLILFEQLRDERLDDSRYGDRMVTVNFQYCPERFELAVADEGPGFNWRPYMDEYDPASEINTKPYGRGFVLIRHVMDEVIFNEVGNTIQLVKARVKR